TSLGVGSDQAVSSISWVFAIFGIVWILLGLIGKVLGAGLGARISGFKGKEALSIGIGMMARAEVVIVTAQEGVDAKLVEPG
ncbi:MAG TPA: sodium:proton antiporter, partial [Firmicutes bacterium]|nr:sodium:proton antiporter [Bacillota bacterium]